MSTVEAAEVDTQAADADKDAAAAPELLPVQGPSALGGGWRRFVDLVYLMSVNEFRRSYFGTALGYVWSVVRPLMLFVVLLVVFTHIIRLGPTVHHYPQLLLFNIVLFGFFQGATGACVGSIVMQEGIVRKTQFPRLAIPMAVVLTTLFDLVLNLLVVFVFVLADGIAPQWTWLLLPVVIAALFMLTLAVGMILSSLFPRFRDIGIVWTVFATALFYATPVLYPLEIVHARLRDVIAINPVAPILEMARKWIIDPHAPAPGSAAAGGPVRLLIAAAVFVGVCVLAVWVFNREAPRIAEEL